MHAAGTKIHALNMQDLSATCLSLSEYACQQKGVHSKEQCHAGYHCESCDFCPLTFSQFGGCTPLLRFCTVENSACRHTLCVCENTGHLSLCQVHFTLFTDVSLIVHSLSLVFTAGSGSFHWQRGARNGLVAAGHPWLRPAHYHDRYLDSHPMGNLRFFQSLCWTVSAPATPACHVVCAVTQYVHCMKVHGTASFAARLGVSGGGSDLAEESPMKPNPCRVCLQADNWCCASSGEPRGECSEGLVWKWLHQVWNECSQRTECSTIFLTDLA